VRQIFVNEAPDNLTTTLTQIKPMAARHDAWAYLKDVQTKLPTCPNSRIEELLH
jgi:hypothetical protein